MKPPFTPAFLLVFFQIEGIQDPLFHGQLHQLRQCLLIVLDLDAVAVPEGLQGIDHIGLVVQQDDLSVFYKEDIENLIVIYDDIDIPTGTIRLRKKRQCRNT